MQLIQGATGSFRLNPIIDGAGYTPDENGDSSFTLADFQLRYANGTIQQLDSTTPGVLTQDGSGCFSYAYTALDTANPGQCQLECISAIQGNNSPSNGIYVMEPVEITIGPVAASVAKGNVGTY